MIESAVKPTNLYFPGTPSKLLKKGKRKEGRLFFQFFSSLVFLLFISLSVFLFLPHFFLVLPFSGFSFAFAFYVLGPSSFFQFFFFFCFFLFFLCRFLFLFCFFIFFLVLTMTRECVTVHHFKIIITKAFWLSSFWRRVKFNLHKLIFLNKELFPFCLFFCLLSVFPSLF